MKKESNFRSQSFINDGDIDITLNSYLVAFNFDYGEKLTFKLLIRKTKYTWFTMLTFTSKNQKSVHHQTTCF
ncbi:hypothetical protein TTHERM_000860411 (macronuclear) [Tetrahymena thermophila SB210]|uniref:Uncharacterized protein n=1 Tax=Tetrahymena thermophila (strain SB210) TaxID=312017 RepID=W7XHX1_TETTS|nr:hypothetical protein TTHERM_000860411 [Tetrahymena thermophila SB210]EWS74136.1 hypothetical protein TTHERM_000860411 [Tetrahymena thermophila SB210]|eukprot:XP_012653321.1 hypothetical protein TTHERM_000860411 [Tetrahymena thermophila SB210]